jgi:hypothetical protein
VCNVREEEMDGACVTDGGEQWRVCNFMRKTGSYHLADIVVDGV